ncbi:MAG: Rpn family recombination-promoting nuclease/putative transposase, partial [Clostridiales bacterium]|nr:Rpn family recombination-promoting nuclease/putative transposase [Clostridiales bacterium]
MGALIKRTNDLAFKKALGSEGALDSLAGLIEDFFFIKPRDLALKNPYSIKAYKESLYGRDANVMRYTEKDIAASFTAADFTTELQLKGTSFFDERSLYYPFERYCSNYNKGVVPSIDPGTGKKKYNRYSSLIAVYSLNILGHGHFSDKRSLRIFEMHDPARNLKPDRELIKIGYFEFSKEDFETGRQKFWADYFMDRPIPDNAPEYIKKAAEAVAFENLDEEEKRMYNAAEQWQADYEAMWVTRFEEGVEKGIEKGIEKGELKKLIA